jgi:hypothetical protein
MHRCQRFCHVFMLKVVFSLDYLNRVKMMAFQLCFNRGNRNINDVGFDKKFPGEEGSVRRCIVVKQQPVNFCLFPLKVSSHHTTSFKQQDHY